MLSSILIAVIPPLLTTAADLIKTFANSQQDHAQILAQMQAAMNTAQAALDALHTAHAARVAELAAAKPLIP